jgi:hypothetical protein
LLWFSLLAGAWAIIAIYRLVSDNQYLTRHYLVPGCEYIVNARACARAKESLAYDDRRDLIEFGQWLFLPLVVAHAIAVVSTRKPGVGAARRTEVPSSRKAATTHRQV